MNKSVRATVIFGIVFLLLLAWYLVYEQKFRPERKEKEEKAKNIVTFLSEEIKELEIEWLKNKTPKIRLKKFGENWRIVEPVEDEADNSTIKSMISTLTSTKIERTVAEELKNLSPYGLENPHIRIKVVTEGGETCINIGKDTPVGYNSYIQLKDGKDVILVSRTLKNSFDKKIKDLRNKKIFSIAQHEVDEVEIDSIKEDIVFKKEKNDNWVLAKTNIPIDSTKWNNTFNAIMDLNASDFIDGKEKALSEYGLSNPFAKIYVSNVEKVKKETLLLGKAKDKYFAKVGDKKVIYEVTKDLFDKVITPSTEYHSKKMARFDRFSITKIRLERSTEPLELEKKDSNNWFIPTEITTKIDYSKVEDFLTTIQDTKVIKFSSTTKEINSPDLILQFFEKDKEKLTIRLKKEGKDYLGLSSDYSVSFFITKADYDKINVPKKYFLSVEKAEEKTDKAVN